MRPRLSLQRDTFDGHSFAVYAGHRQIGVVFEHCGVEDDAERGFLGMTMDDDTVIEAAGPLTCAKKLLLATLRAQPATEAA